MMTDKPDAATAIADALAKAETEINFLMGAGLLCDMRWGERPASKPPFWWRGKLFGIVTLTNRAPELLAENAALKAEIERLRHTLQRMVDTTDWACDAAWVKRIARAALEARHD